MKHYFSAVRKHHKFTVHGEELYIEYRPRLKAFDLIYYPNKGACMDKVSTTINSFAGTRILQRWLA